MPKKKVGLQHYKDQAVLKALGLHCRKLRIQLGYSIDRLSKESDRLSPSVIHRLENGLGPVTVLTIIRYATTLRVPPKALFEIEFPSASIKSSSIPQSDEPPLWQPDILSHNHPKVKTGKFKTVLPLYSLKAAAGYFSTGEEVVPEGWIEISGQKKLDSQMFVARAIGNSMLPKIRSGDFLVFRANTAGSRQGKILLVQYSGPADPETGGSYTVKKYQSSKVIHSDSTWDYQQVVLFPLNADYEPIILNSKDEKNLRIIAEYLFTLESSSD